MDKIVPIMNRGWQAHSGSDFLGKPFPRGDSPYADISDQNKLLYLVKQLYNFDWLLYHSGSSNSETYLLNHTGNNIVLVRETGILNLAGDYEYILPNFQQPKVQVEELLGSVHFTPEILNSPEPNLLYIKFSNVNLRNPYSGIVHFYDPISHQRLALNLLQFVAYLEQQFNPVMGSVLEEAFEGKKLNSDSEERLLRKWVSQMMLLSVLFAPQKIDFERLLRIVTHFADYGFQRMWQYLTLITQDNALHINDQLLYDLYPHEVLNQVRYKNPTPIDY